MSSVSGSDNSSDKAQAKQGSTKSMLPKRGASSPAMTSVEAPKTEQQPQSSNATNVETKAKTEAATPSATTTTPEPTQSTSQSAAPGAVAATTPTPSQPQAGVTSTSPQPININKPITEDFLADEQRKFMQFHNKSALIGYDKVAPLGNNLSILSYYISKLANDRNRSPGVPASWSSEDEKECRELLTKMNAQVQRIQQSTRSPVPGVQTSASKSDSNSNPGITSAATPSVATTTPITPQSTSQPAAPSTVANTTPTPPQPQAGVTSTSPQPTNTTVDTKAKQDARPQEQITQKPITLRSLIEKNNEFFNLLHRANDGQKNTTEFSNFKSQVEKLGEYVRNLAIEKRSKIGNSSEVLASPLAPEEQKRFQELLSSMNPYAEKLSAPLPPEKNPTPSESTPGPNSNPNSGATPQTPSPSVGEQNYNGGITKELLDKKIKEFEKIETPLLWKIEENYEKIAPFSANISKLLRYRNLGVGAHMEEECRRILRETDVQAQNLSTLLPSPAENQAPPVGRQATDAIITKAWLIKKQQEFHDLVSIAAREHAKHIETNEFSDFKSQLAKLDKYILDFDPLATLKDLAPKEAKEVGDLLSAMHPYANQLSSSLTKANEKIEMDRKRVTDLKEQLDRLIELRNIRKEKPINSLYMQQAELKKYLEKLSPLQSSKDGEKFPEILDANEQKNLDEISEKIKARWKEVEFNQKKAIRRIDLPSIPQDPKSTPSSGSIIGVIARQPEPQNTTNTPINGSDLVQRAKQLNPETTSVVGVRTPTQPQAQLQPQAQRQPEPQPRPMLMSAPFSGAGKVITKQQYLDQNNKLVQAINNKTNPQFKNVTAEKMKDGGIKIKVKLEVDSGSITQQIHRTFDAQSRPVIKVSDPPRDESINVLMESSKDIQPLTMSKPCNNETTLLRLYEAAIVHNRKINFSPQDKALLEKNNNPLYRQLQQIEKDPNLVKELQDLHKGAGRKYGAELPSSLSNKIPTPGLNFTNDDPDRTSSPKPR